MTDLRISDRLSLPLDLAGEATAILAKRGAGKSNTAKVVVEEILDSELVQVIALDPVGHWWSLRAGADGKPGGGYPVAVFGGMHGDLPLEPTAGKVLAQTAVESGQSIVLDVSGLDSNGAMQRFAYEFAEELYRLKQASPSPLLLVLEEADEFAPQTTAGPNVARMVGAFARLMKRGRGRGIGMLVVSQRSAALSKNVLDQADTLIVMRTVGPRDRAAIEGWIKHQSAEGADEVLPSLPSLATGEAWVWNPERDLLRRVQVRKARTFDSTQSSRPGQRALTAEVKPIDVERLGRAIAATVERVKENDPAELRRRIKTLEQQLAARPSETVVERVEVKVPVEVPVLEDELVARLEAEVEGLLSIVEVVAPLRAVADQIQEALRAARAVPPTPVAAPATPDASPRPAVARRERAVAPADGDVRLGKGERTVLGILAEYPEGRTHNELAFLAGYSAKASTLGVILATLRRAGLVEPGQPIRPTAAGLEAAGGVRERPTGRELLDEWLRHPRMGEGERRVLLALVDADHDLTNDELCELTGYSPTASTMGVILSKLRKLGLVEKGARRVAPEFREAIGRVT